MLNIDEIMKQILAEFKYEPEFEEYYKGQPERGRAPWLANYNEFEFLTKCMKFKLFRDDDKVEIKNDSYLPEYCWNEELKKYNALEDFIQFNSLVDLYKECWRYKEMLKDNDKRRNGTW